MATREEMVRTLEKFCDRQEKCNGCLLEKFEDDGQCDFGEWGDSALAVAYNRIYKNGEARLDGSHLKEQDTKPDMVNHPSRIIEEMRRLFELFDDDVKIFVNKSNKTVDIKINM